jgi:serine/threonine protein kinase
MASVSGEVMVSGEVVSGEVMALSTPDIDTDVNVLEETNDFDYPNPARYTQIKVIQKSLFGETRLIFDSWLKRNMVVKVSHIHLIKSRNATTQNNVLIQEDVRREVHIMKDLAILNQLPDHSICAQTHGLSITPKVANLRQGYKYINGFVGSFEDETYHYLVTEHANGESLMEVIGRTPQTRISEDIARLWFRQICLAIKFLHGHSIVHLDLSLENICMNFPSNRVEGKYTEEELVGGQIKLIDFGLAGKYPTETQSNHLNLLHEVETSTCACLNCTNSERALLAKAYAIERWGNPLRNLSSSELKFLCRPTCGQVHKIGKMGYMAPEIYADTAWDAYKADIYSLGVILYILLTGRPPYKKPIQSDMWFHVIFNGNWRQPKIKNQTPASVYNWLSEDALDLIDLMISPQSQRPCIDQVLAHPWLRSPIGGLKRDRSIPSGRETKYARQSTF